MSNRQMKYLLDLISCCNGGIAMVKKLTNILPPIVDCSTKVLIVGSMPGRQWLEKQQYYSNPRNQF